ncbi:Fpg/Nei family DNA glycosylase [Mycolicibacterium sp. S3B2]|uniref:Fpg/Nei family DNA glycosylase n=1 Tax=Mycolicibacterium sp. S3B2 TaxID=3415120 RepID=UPI003C79A472
MPELPDVEGFRERLSATLPGRRIDSVEVRDSGVLRNASARALNRVLSGRRFEEPRRHGKWLLLPAEGPTLLVHSGMTGRPYYTSAGDGDRHDRVVITLDRGELHYADQRKLRGIWLVGGHEDDHEDNDDLDDMLGDQGPDALGLDRHVFTEILRRHRGALKPTLMDQSVIAGLGNLLIDEICWRARLNPKVRIAALDDSDIQQLHRAVTSVLRTAVRHGCVPGLRRWLTRVRDDPDPSCPRCGTRLSRSRVGGRSTVWCPRCQPG